MRVLYEDLGNGEVAGYVTPSANHEGFPGYLHGGLAATLMDETMARAINLLGVHGMTARMEIRYREKVPVEKPLVVTARVVKNRRSIVDAESKILLEDGTVAVESTARFMIVGKMEDPEISHK